VSIIIDNGHDLRATRVTIDPNLKARQTAFAGGLR
jgi:hypothetical protein